jgi:hypothetical protein
LKYNAFCPLEMLQRNKCIWPLVTATFHYSKITVLTFLHSFTV